MASQTKNLTSSVSDAVSIQTTQSVTTAINLSLELFQVPDDNPTFGEIFRKTLENIMAPTIDSVRKTIQPHIKDKDLLTSVMEDLEKLFEGDKKNLAIGITAKVINYNNTRAEGLSLNISRTSQSWAFNLVVSAGAFYILAVGLKSLGVGFNCV
ncbi:hypothetical protein G7Y89_g10034 [Cudoniella acicularis]|uniref:Uncharacterized protein n=1 Tax=Cudoniella acicularis TaxID=354080 RepID=A0A8H4RH84_9HELO|nr:hypothetical protein G7Y89_g10034 [Cudoniella acicularis]